MIDAIELAIPPTAADPPKVQVFPVDRPADRSCARRPVEDPVVVAGDGEGLVDAASAGVVDGKALVLYSAFVREEPRRAAPRARPTAPTSSSPTRTGARARHWGAVRDMTGYTERAGEKPLVADPGDKPLEPFPGAGDDTKTVTEQRGVALGHGDDLRRPALPLARGPAGDGVRRRPAHGVDRGRGRQGGRGEARHRPRRSPVTTDQVTLVQPQTGHPRPVDHRRDADASTARTRSASRSVADSRTGGGQIVTFPRRTFHKLEITVDAVESPTNGLGPVGFAEVEHRRRVTGRRAGPPPRRPAPAAGTSSLAHNLTLVMTRMRGSQAEYVRTDEETGPPARLRPARRAVVRAVGHGAARRPCARRDARRGRSASPTPRTVASTVRRVVASRGRRARPRPRRRSTATRRPRGAPTSATSPARGSSSASRARSPSTTSTCRSSPTAGTRSRPSSRSSPRVARRSRSPSRRSPTRRRPAARSGAGAASHRSPPTKLRVTVSAVRPESRPSSTSAARRSSCRWRSPSSASRACTPPPTAGRVHRRVPDRPPHRRRQAGRRAVHRRHHDGRAARHARRLARAARARPGSRSGAGSSTCSGEARARDSGIDLDRLALAVRGRRRGRARTRCSGHGDRRRGPTVQRCASDSGPVSYDLQVSARDGPVLARPRPEPQRRLGGQARRRHVARHADRGQRHGQRLVRRPEGITATSSVHLEWTPQKRVWIGIILSAAGVLLCLVAAVRPPPAALGRHPGAGRRRRRSSDAAVVPVAQRRARRRHATADPVARRDHPSPSDSSPRSWRPPPSASSWRGRDVRRLLDRRGRLFLRGRWPSPHSSSWSATSWCSRSASAIPPSTTGPSGSSASSTSRGSPCCCSSRTWCSTTCPAPRRASGAEGAV